MSLFHPHFLPVSGAVSVSHRLLGRLQICTTPITVVCAKSAKMENVGELGPGELRVHSVEPQKIVESALGRGICIRLSAM